MECPKTPEMRGGALTTTPLRGPLAPPFRVAGEIQPRAPVTETAGDRNQAPAGEPGKEAPIPEAPISMPEESRSAPRATARETTNGNPTPAAPANANSGTPGEGETRRPPATQGAGKKNGNETPSRRKGDSRPNKVNPEF